MNCVIEVRGLGCVITVSENKIDNRLKDAAPDMAEALKKVIRDYDLTGEVCGNSCIQVRAALAKAGIS